MSVSYEGSNMKWFVERLARTVVSAETRNPYTHNRTRSNAARRHNLSVYLTQMLARQPRVMLVGEALGYRGGGVTGVPFVSHNLLMTHQFYAGWEMRPIVTTLPQSEASSTILHAVCDAVGLHALHWNAFPFHPHMAGRPTSNRKPAAGELAQGGAFLQLLLNQFEIETVVAVGNSAEKSLTALNIPHTKVRHPSHGGKQAFHKGLLALTPQKQ